MRGCVSGLYPILLLCVWDWVFSLGCFTQTRTPWTFRIRLEPQGSGFCSMLGGKKMNFFPSPLSFFSHTGSCCPWQCWAPSWLKVSTLAFPCSAPNAFPSAQYSAQSSRHCKDPVLLSPSHLPIKIYFHIHPFVCFIYSSVSRIWVFKVHNHWLCSLFDFRHLVHSIYSINNCYFIYMINDKSEIITNSIFSACQSPKNHPECSELMAEAKDPYFYNSVLSDKLLTTYEPQYSCVGMGKTMLFL